MSQYITREMNKPNTLSELNEVNELNCLDENLKKHNAGHFPFMSQYTIQT